MPIGSILLGLALVVVVAPFVAGPFLKNGQRQKKPLESRQDDSPGLAKQSALAALRDLDFDFRTGKVAEEDYLPLRQRLVAEAAQALQVTEATASSSSDWDAEIEAAIRAVRASSRAARRSACPQCHAPVGDDDRFCPKCGAALGVTCPQCRSAVQATDKFCARCGATLKSEVVSIS
jgi:RNA polymerase subunit RPABC4/transcription elongation factor Spt4